MVENRNHDEKQEKKKLIQENKRLKKELAKKEKALAEMAALYTLKKSRGTLGGRRERLIPDDMRKLAVELIQEANENGARIWKACEALEISVSTFERWRKGKYTAIVKRRNKTMVEARKRNPQRWSCQVKQLPEKHVVYLNPSADTRVLIKAKKDVAAA